ncbi:phospholipase A [bacterium AH-315-K03]|nr:phospholipase A [bacterium AH-315-K03]
MKYLYFWVIIFFIAVINPVFSEPDVDNCVRDAAVASEGETTVAQLREHCRGLRLESQAVSPKSRIAQRLSKERASDDTGHMLTPHRRNYILPFTYSKNPNEEPFKDFVGVIESDDELTNEEAKYQISLKVALLENLFVDKSAVYFGFTLSSYWQVYNSDISAPFRETNYEPEIFWLGEVDWNPFDADASYLAVGFAHQSNGRSLPLSRSWNRVYVNFLWEEGPWAFSVKPWYRIPEDDKENSFDTTGDDNPDIDDYMGFFESRTIYHWQSQEVSLMFRNNLRSDNKGAVQLDWSFPLWGGLKGYVQYFNGYGESLIDYNESIERIGVGVLLTRFL